MGRKKAHTPEEIVAKLHQVEVLATRGKAVAEAVRAIGVTEQAAQRAAAGRGVQLAPRSAGADRAMEAALQHGTAHSSLGYRPPAVGAGKVRGEEGVVGRMAAPLDGRALVPLDAFVAKLQRRKLPPACPSGVGVVSTPGFEPGAH